MGSISVIPYARNVPLLLFHERFNEVSLPGTSLHFQAPTTNSAAVLAAVEYWWTIEAIAC
jgi:hypothetical protein